MKQEDKQTNKRSLKALLLLSGGNYNWDRWNTALTVVLQRIGQGYKRHWIVLSVIWSTSIILGNSHDKTLGKAMVLLWSCRNNSVDYSVGYDTGKFFTQKARGHRI
jgi:hypothetical protein